MAKCTSKRFIWSFYSCSEHNKLCKVFVFISTEKSTLKFRLDSNYFMIKLSIFAARSMNGILSYHPTLAPDKPYFVTNNIE